jgi:capsule biosynthesis phosphatase
MRIVVDLDGVICPIKRPGENYADLPVLPGAIEALRAWRAAGHVVIIQAARHMATCDGNLGKVMRRVGQVTLEWLERNGIEYDEIFFGKPNGHVYVDDRALRFGSWEQLTEVALEEAAQER